MATKKPASKKSSSKLKATDLRAATAASVAAVLGKQLPVKPGVLAGLWLDSADIKALDSKAEDVASDIAREFTGRFGVRVTPKVVPAGSGVLVGFVQPTILKR